MASQFAHYDDVPQRFTEAWACAIMHVLELVRDAQEEVDLRRALKWLLALHDILLRLRPRGGRRSRNILEQRFASWRNGDLGEVLSWWLAVSPVKAMPDVRPIGVGECDQLRSHG